MNDYCPRCAGLLLITGVNVDGEYKWEAACQDCRKRAVWNDKAGAWEPTVNRRFLIATAATFAILLWIVGHAEVMT